MNRPASEGQFPARISRSLAFALTVVVLVVVLVGGTSLALAIMIFRNNEAVGGSTAIS